MHTCRRGRRSVIVTLSSAHAGEPRPHGSSKAKWNYWLGKGGPLSPPRGLERLGEPGFQEFAQLGCRLELWDGIQFFECRGKRIRKTPDRSRLEFLVLRLEVEVMHAAGKVLWSFQSAFDKGLVNDDLGGDIGQFASLPGFDLFAHRLEVSLHSVNANRDAVDERERLRVLREHGSEHSRDNVAKLKLSSAYALGPKWGNWANGGLSCMAKVRRLRAGYVQYEAGVGTETDTSHQIRPCCHLHCAKLLPHNCFMCNRCDS